MLAKLLLVIVILVLLFDRGCELREKYGEGALIQLQAKGPQDTYLTDDAYRHLYYPYDYHDYYGYYGYPYREMLWNNPTRYPDKGLYDLRPLYW